MSHEAHTLIRRRLKQVLGHVAKVIEMSEQGRPCADVAQQLEAIESTVRSAKRLLVHNHLEQCIVDALSEGKMTREDAMHEFAVLTKYF